MPEQEHPWDGISDDLFEWMQGEVEYQVEALRGGHRAPFSAGVTEKEKQDYYRRQMYKAQPDGTILYDQPNPEGRDKLLKQYGTQTYAQIMESVRPKKGLRPTPNPEEELRQAVEASMPPMPEDTEPVPLEAPV